MSTTPTATELADAAPWRTTGRCPRCGAPLATEEYEDGVLDGVRYLDRRIACPRGDFEYWEADDEDA